jgi:CheY-like chemotaxis protein
MLFVKNLIRYFIEKPNSQKPVRVFIVEDEALMCLLLKDMLSGTKYTVASVTAFIEDALYYIDKEDFDVAILDVNIRGEMIYEVAHKLEKKGIPYIFSTGYDLVNLSEEFRSRPTLQKPYDLNQLFLALENCALSA